MFDLGMVAWCVLIFMAFIVAGDLALGLIVAAIFGAVVLIPEVELVLYLRSMLVVMSCFLLVHNLVRPLKKKASEPEAQETTGELVLPKIPFTRDEAEKFNQLLEKAKKLREAQASG